MALPTFIMIGVAKAGTTSFFRYLDQHPQIYMLPDKSTSFFGYEDARNWRWTDEGKPPAMRHFLVKTWEAYQRAFDGATDELAIGEVSPQYFRCPTAAARIRECLPGVKLVVSLRNPADRAFSGFLMRTRRGEVVRGLHDELTPQASHMFEGLYYKRLKRYFDQFPRQQIKVFLFEEFKQDPARAIMDLYEYVGVDAHFAPDTSVRYNSAAVPKIRLLNRLFYHPALIRTAKALLPEAALGVAKQVREQNLKKPPKFPADLRAELLSYYREDILRLQDLLDRDLSIWLNPA